MNRRRWRRRAPQRRATRTLEISRQRFAASMQRLAENI